MFPDGDVNGNGVYYSYGSPGTDNNNDAWFVAPPGVVDGSINGIVSVSYGSLRSHLVPSSLCQLALLAASASAYTTLSAFPTDKIAGHVRRHLCVVRKV